MQAICTNAAGARSSLVGQSRAMRLRLKEMRKARELTQVALGEMVGVTHATIQRWEQHKRRPKFDQLLKLCAVLNCTMGALFGETQQYSAEQQEAADLVGRMAPDRARRWLDVGKDMAGDSSRPERPLSAAS